MAEILRLPRMSDTMEEGVIAELFIQVGDTIKTGDVIAEVETDKATMEWEAFQEGTVIHVGVKQGDSVPVNDLIAILGDEGEDIASILEQEKAKQPVEEKEVSEKANSVEQTVSVPNDTAEASTVPVSTENGRVKASPLAKKLAAEKQINLSVIQGSGEQGRIIKRDVEQYAEAGTTTENRSAEVIKQPLARTEESFQDTPLSQMRKTIAKRLAESKYSAPHFYLTTSINMNALIEARTVINERASVKISFNDIIIKATALSIRKHPAVNTSWLGDAIRQNNHIHIGMAVAVNEGLVVPVLRHADVQSLTQIANTTKSMADKARNKKLMPEDMQGHTFSISNLGMMGIELFTAIINPPDACILAVGSIKKELALAEGEIIENNMMSVTLSCDHRLVDGASGAQFLSTLKQYLEEPLSMLVG